MKLGCQYHVSEYANHNSQFAFESRTFAVRLLQKIYSQILEFECWKKKICSSFGWTTNNPVEYLQNDYVQSPVDNFADVR